MDNMTLKDKSLLSGMLIGIGIIANLVIPNRYIGAVLFSYALLVIIHLDLELYTGKIGYATDRIRTFKQYIFIFLCNILGVITALLIGSIVISSDTDIRIQFVEAATIKYNQGYMVLFCKGILCGVLMLIAVHCKNTIITIFCISIFILSGFEHCIVDFTYLIPVLASKNIFILILKFLCVVLGNSIGAIVTRILLDES